MPLKTLKKDTADVLTLEWILQVKNYKLTLDRKLCVGCEICTAACPKEAITTINSPKIEGQKAAKAKVDIDLAKCNFCGICDVTCPYGAIKVTLNDSHNLPILQKESYPKLVKDITVNSELCPKDCEECNSICPLSLISLSKTTFDGKPVKNINELSQQEKNRVKVHLDIQEEKCPTCSICEFKCAPGAIKVKKTIQGKTTINTEKCPTGCQNCLDVCPITGALVLGEDHKVHVNETFCTYCGACKNVCPVDDALIIRRSKIAHSTVHSGTWNKALERITCSDNATKTLGAQASQNRLKAIEKRFHSETLKTEALK
jgi:4Fe-4S ferredoxin